MLHFLLVSLFSSYLLYPLAHAAPTNVSIDDTNGDAATGAQIRYSPSGAWQLGQTCTACTAGPSANQTYDETWHDSTYYPSDSRISDYPGEIISASANFTGTAVYIYCILTRSSSSPDGNTDMTFYIDDEEVDSFSLAPNGDKTYLYNQLVFAWTGLDGSTSHSVTLESGHAGVKALVLLDRIVYTTDDPSSSGSTTTSSSQQSSSTSSSSQSSAEETSSSQSSTSGSSSSLSSQTSVSTGKSTSTRSFTSSDSDGTVLPSLTLSASSSSASGSGDNDASSESSRSNTGTIVGATVGGLGGLCVAVGLWWMCARRRRGGEEDEVAQVIQPFVSRNTFGSPRSGFGGGGVMGGNELVGGGLGLNGGTNGFRGYGANFVTLPASGDVHGTTGIGTVTRGSTTLRGTSTSSPTTLDNPHSPFSVPSSVTPYPVSAYVAGLNAGAESDPSQHRYAINVRSEKMRQLQEQQAAQEQAQRAAAQNQGRGPTRKNGLSPFSPTPLYSPTQDPNDVVSPSSGSATFSAGDPNSQAHSQGHIANERERLERIRRWNSTGRPNVAGVGVGAGEGIRTDGWDDDLNASLEPVSPHAVLRPNRRREPAPLDDRPPVRPNLPPRPRRSHARPLTRILEITHNRGEAESDIPEVPRTAGEEELVWKEDLVPADVDALSDAGSDVSWQQKLVHLFSISSVAGTPVDTSAPSAGVGKGWKETGRTPPAAPGVPPPGALMFNPALKAQSRAVPTPPPPYRGQEGADSAW